VINPADLPVSHKDRQQKTDTRDSRALAKCLRAGVLEGIHIPDEELEADRILIRQRFSLVKDLARMKNRVKSLLYFKGIQIPSEFTKNHTRRWSNNYITWLSSLEDPNKSFLLVIKNEIRKVQKLRAEVLVVTRQIRELSRSERYKDKSKLILGVPGIGLVSTMTILLQLGDINRFKRLDELCSYVGLIPKMHNSGDRIRDGKMVNRGRKELKLILIEASWIAVRKDSALMAKYDELIKRMNKNKAIIRIARKLLSRIRHILQKNEGYELGLVG
jgi:transposase